MTSERIGKMLTKTLRFDDDVTNILRNNFQRKEDALFEIRYGNEPTPRLILNYPEIPDS